MRYYSGRTMRYRRPQSWGRWSHKPSQTDALVRKLGNAVVEIARAFFALEPEALDKLFRVFGSLHGEPAESYARRTYPEWKSGATRLSGQTLHRLVALVPPFLSAEVRFGLLQEVLKKQPPTSYGRQGKVVRINTQESASGFTELDGALDSMRHEDALAHIPEDVMKTAKWLYNDDITAARAMLAQAETRKNEIIKASAEREIALLRRTVQTGQVKTARYNVQMPAGSLSVEVFTPGMTLWQTLFG